MIQSDDTTTASYDSAHSSVLLREVVDGLALREGGTYVDATYGGGGHTRAILEHTRVGRLIAFDVDPNIVPFAHPALRFVATNFRHIKDALQNVGVEEIDGVLFDFGLSSMQLDRGERGFSFRFDAPLDMRMNPDRGESALDLLQRVDEKTLADMIFTYGEERAARRIARGLIARREKNMLPKTTGELARCIAGIVHRPGHRERVHPATRTFQALRIVVNDEIAAIREGLAGATDMLAGRGRLCAISFHSLEDRCVKQHIRNDQRLTQLTRRPLLPTTDEIASNPRARSARLRIAERGSSS